MKILYLLPILIGSALAGDTDKNVLNNKIYDSAFAESSSVVKGHQLKAYIDGSSKLELNDINSSDVVEDTWHYEETKTLTIEADFTGMDISSRYLEVKLPVGMEMINNPEALVDGKNIISVDSSSFKTTSIKTSNSYNYTPRTGSVKYYLSENVSKISMDILVAVDKKLWCTINDVFAHDISQNAVEIYAKDKDVSIGKKIDGVKVNGKNWSAYRHTFVDSNILNQSSFSIKTIMALDFVQSQQSRIFKKVKTSMEVPYFEYTQDGVTKKKYLDIRDISVSDNGSYEIIDNVIYFEWNNVYMSGFSYNLMVDTKDSGSPDNTSIKIKRGAISTQQYFNEDREFEVANESTVSSMIISSTEEKMSYGYESRNVRKSNSELDSSLNYFGKYRIVNHGADSSPKKIAVDFPLDNIGVKSFRLLLPSKAGSYEVKYVLEHIETKEKLEGVLNISKGSTNSDSGYLLSVSSIIKNIDNSSLIDSTKYYLRNIEYTVDSFPNKYWSYNSQGGSSASSSGSVLGEVLNNTPSASSRIHYKTYNIAEDGAEELVNTSTSTVTIASDGDITAGITDGYFVDEKGDRVDEISSGNTIRIKGKAEVSSYPYRNTNYATSLVFHLKLPRGASINESKTIFNIKQGSSVIPLQFYVSNKDNPRKASDGDNIYDIRFTNKDGIGYFKEDLSSFGYIEYDLSLDLNVGVKTRHIYLKDMIFLSSDDLLIRGGGAWDKYFVIDRFDVDNNGSASNQIATIPTNTSMAIAVISNSNWLDTSSSIDVSGKPSSGDGISLENSKQTLKYNIHLNNVNEGYIRAGNFEYFIPIPKKNLEYNSYIKNVNEVFNFNMVLMEKFPNVPEFTALYSYDNESFMPYSNSLDLSKVSMVKLINTQDIIPTDNFDLSVKMNCEEGSWDKSDSNDVVWSAYGNQVYEKNGSESSYLHILDSVSVEIVKPPAIIENLLQAGVNEGESVTLESNVDLGIPLADIKWQYRKKSGYDWVDLGETSDTLLIDNVEKAMDGYQYRYQASNKQGTAISNSATLKVFEGSSPIIKLTEIQDGDSYKIRIDVSDDDGVSHIILPDGTRVDGDTYIMDAEPNIEYIVKAYDLKSNESTAKIKINTGLEPKTVSSNLDVYIKSENMLSISLSSNSISFDDFNGSEDMEMMKSLEMRINSSLPYEINAYLEDEIQNADKSEIMNKSIFNLKESSDTNYKEFIDIKTKLNLVSDSDAGNDKVHDFDFKLKGGIAHKKDVYKATIKFEVKQK